MDTLVRMEMDSRSGLVEDKFSMSFAVTDVLDHSPATNSDLANAFSTFLNTVPTGGLAQLSAMLSPEILVDNGLAVKLYDATGKLAGGPANPLGSPYAEYAGWDINGAVTPSSPGLPAEVAVCVTLEAEGRAAAPVETPDGPDADDKVDRPKQRLTGRFFFGPLNTSVLSDVFGQVRPGENLLDTMRLAVDELNENIFTACGGVLAVWSRKNAAMVPVHAVSVDNSFDTIRSRGADATSRQRSLI